MTSLNKIQNGRVQKPQDKNTTKIKPWFNVWEYIIGAIIGFVTLVVTIGVLGHYAPSFNLKSVAILILIFLMTLWQVWLLAKLLLAPVLLFFTQFKTGSKPKDGNIGKALIHRRQETEQRTIKKALEANTKVLEAIARQMGIPESEYKVTDTKSDAKLDQYTDF